MRKTKIICTLGPATDSEEMIRELMLSGMNVARLNFSHGDYKEHGARLERVKKLREEMGLNIATLLDTKGPEIRTGCFASGTVTLKEGQKFTLTTREILGDETGCSVTYKGLPEDVTVDSVILIDDGLVELTVLRVEGSEIVCRVENGGEVSDRKGINVPGAHLRMEYISEKDAEDILFAISEGFDFIAASFVRSAADILEIRKILDDRECRSIGIIAKIENMQGVKNLDEILKVSDGVMVARGDMGVEVPLEDVPAIQKSIIRKVYSAGKPVITATQMLDSMMKNPRPTRAEATDVANAIYDGTSAIMLSGETARGQWPVEAVRTMAKIATRTEQNINYVRRLRRRFYEDLPGVTDAISHATCLTAHEVDAAAIVTVTKSGRTARMIAKYRPVCPIIGCTTDPHVCRQLSLEWGVTPLLISEMGSTDELFDVAVDAAEQAGLVSGGQMVVITAGVPLGVSGTTNMMKVHVVGHILLSGTGISGKTVSGTLCVCKSLSELERNFNDGDIIVVPETTNDFLPYLKRASGIVTEAGGLSSHAAIVGLSLDIPVIIGAKQATEILKQGSFVMLDEPRGVVCIGSGA